jgi:predicted Zn-dependent protease
VLRQLGKELPAADFTLTAGTMLSQLFDTSIASDCANVRPETVAALANVLRSNPRYASEPTYNQFHEKLLAGIARYQGDVAAAIEHLRAAIGFVPSSELNMMMVTALASRGNFDDAREFIDDAMAAGPIHPLRALQWRRDLRGLQNYIDELERVQQ